MLNVRREGSPISVGTVCPEDMEDSRYSHSIFGDEVSLGCVQPADLAC